MNDGQDDGFFPERCPFNSSLTDEDVVRRVLEGEVPLFEIIIRRHNRRLYRIVRSILKDDMETEDAVQEAYLSAYSHLSQFAGRASLGTWLLSIAINEARRRMVRRIQMEKFDGDHEGAHVEGAFTSRKDAEHEVATREVTTVLERFIDELPEHFRTVFILRAVGQLSLKETAQVLDLREVTVRTRLHRARRYLRKLVYAHFGEAVSDVFQFGSWRCDRIVSVVMGRFEQLKQPAHVH
jgi:RNA polymerase sigma-70 factor (ECF subfamily)